ncbi:sulfur oxidation protein SoxY [Azorhizobium oxalatiphilum]|uniref:Sulfur oxidation protein SoxY n=1 Tax=Azorhizobium oxalatiphilum TaxID=980631 RepID=A0A917FFV0_9HYPH|nr:SoxY-related AACIE arm protein [Azorhizobium oxalatiphilum]GGF73830.1 sulfur oxidation protein SoxY [Azorhizobium oxalatiphilum]
MSPIPHLKRRDVLLGAAAGLAVLALPARAMARPEMQEAVKAFTKGAMAQEGRVRLDLSPIVENGNAVPLTVDVESPMESADHVRRIALFNEKNPQADIAIFHLSPASGRARISTRIRLATSQQVIAVAEMSDGTYWSQTRDVVVTLAACIEVL